MNTAKVNENQGATVINMPKKKAYTQIPNEILEKLYSPGFHLPGEQRAVFDFILRKTLGWGRESVRLPLSQFKEALGIKKQSADRAIKSLLAKKIILVSKDADTNINIFEINTNIDKWLPSAKMLISANRITPVSKDADKPSARMLPPSIKENIKESIKEKTYSSDFCKSGGSEFDRNQVFIPENLKNISIEEIESSIPQEAVIPESLPAEKPKTEN